MLVASFDFWRFQIQCTLFLPCKIKLDCANRWKHLGIIELLSSVWFFSHRILFTWINSEIFVEKIASLQIFFKWLLTQVTQFQKVYNYIAIVDNTSYWYLRKWACCMSKLGGEVSLNVRHNNWQWKSGAKKKGSRYLSPTKTKLIIFPFYSEGIYKLSHYF